MEEEKRLSQQFFEAKIPAFSSSETFEVSLISQPWTISSRKYYKFD